MKNHNARYTAEEDETIISCISKSPDNLEEAFSKAALILGRSSNGVSQRYYAIIKHKSNIFEIKSRTTTPSNVKNRQQSLNFNDPKYEILLTLYNKLPYASKIHFIKGVVTQL